MTTASAPAACQDAATSARATAPRAMAGERDHGEREDQRERGQHAGLRRRAAAGEADHQHDPAAPPAEPGQLAQHEPGKPA